MCLHDLFSFSFKDTTETITAIDIHSLPSSPTTLNRRDQKQRYRPYSPIRKF